jgi:hypothetical protein
MRVFLDFEASSLGKQGVPIEVAWVFEDGAAEAHLIRPAPGWTDWDAAAEAVHRIPRATLLRDGAAHDWVARRMIDVLAGHDLYASAPSWDGKWLSALLRAAGLPRHALRLRDSEIAFLAAARAAIGATLPPERIDEAAAAILAEVRARHATVAPEHRALADARREQAVWRAVAAAGSATG